MGNDPLEPYYEASVRSMSTSAQDFLYGAFDPTGTLTLDKLPGAFIDATGEEALPIGGFDCAGPSPTLAQIQADVWRGQFHLALVTDGPDPRLHWIAEHCEDLSPLQGGLDTYRCEPPAGC